MHLHVEGQHKKEVLTAHKLYLLYTSLVSSLASPKWSESRQHIFKGKLPNETTHDMNVTEQTVQKIFTRPVSHSCNDLFTLTLYRIKFGGRVGGSRRVGPPSTPRPWMVDSDSLV